MNLWIRTQDRAGISKCEKLYIQVLNGEFHILNENEFPLGIYETRGKALEVLDEIQNILKPTIYYEYNENPIYNSHKEYGNDGNIYETHIYTTSSIKMEPKLKSIEVNDYVYEMPEE